MKTVTTNDFFCGGGGIGLGFKNAGFEINGAWDFDKHSIESYKHNVGDHALLANILNMTHEDVPKSDVWTFGAPCQAFSIAGKQLGMTFKCPSCNHEETFEGELIIDRITFCSECGTLSEAKDIRGVMFFEIMRLLKETEDKPPVIMLENVKGVSKFLDVIAYEYEKRGYKLYKTLYNSKYWGVPQNRERYFIVGVHESIDKEFVFPMQQTEYIPRLKTILEPVVDEKYYITSEKTKTIIEQVEDKLRVKEATKKGYAEAIEGDTLNISHPNSKTRRGRWGNQIAQTLLTGQEQVVVEAKLTVVGTLDMKGMDVIKRVYDKEGLSPTLTTSEGGHRQPKILNEDLTVRKLTPREYARAQGFPESYEIIVSNAQAYKQFGNAVSVPVAQAIAERIKMFLLSL